MRDAFVSSSGTKTVGSRGAFSRKVPGSPGIGPPGRQAEQTNGAETRDNHRSRIASGGGGGLVEYLRQQAVQNPKAFLTQFAKVVPTQLSAEVNGPQRAIIRLFPGRLESFKRGNWCVVTGALVQGCGGRLRSLPYVSPKRVSSQIRRCSTKNAAGLRRAPAWKRTSKSHRARAQRWLRYEDFGRVRWEAG